MPTPYKRQHFLPAAYLKYFSIDQTNCTRSSYIWRFDGEQPCRVRVESQCASDYHYSKRDPEAAERQFQPMESLYCGCIDKIRGGLPLSQDDYGILLSNMFDFFIRNAIHENATGREEIDAYRQRVHIFWSQILMKGAPVRSEADIQHHIKQFWGVHVFLAPPGRQFITSDHPSVWTALDSETPHLHMLTLPITPTQIAVAFDKRFVWAVSQDMSEEDYLTVMDSEMQNAVASIYSATEFTQPVLDTMKQRFSVKEAHDCRIDENTWRLSVAGMPQKYLFSFMRLPPPLM